LETIDEKSVNDEMMKSVDEIIAEVIPNNNTNKRLIFKKNIILIIQLIAIVIGYINCCNKPVNVTQPNKT